MPGGLMRCNGTAPNQGWSIRRVGSRTDRNARARRLVGDRGVRQTGSVDKQPPEPKPWGASVEEAIELCREWMVYLGAADTVAASIETGQLCDLYSTRYLAWVDNQRRNLDLELVDRAARMSAGDGRQALIFIPGGVRPAARKRADELGVGLFRYDAHGGVLDGANTIGRQLYASGLAI